MPTRRLYRYFAGVFLFWFVIVMLILSSVVFLFEFVDLVRRLPLAEFGMLSLLYMTLLKLPGTLESLFHFGLLFATMLAMWRLSRTQELVVARAAGVSMWQILTPLVGAALLVGAFKLLAYSEVVADMQRGYQELSERYLDADPLTLGVSRTGLWMRQETPDGHQFINAARVDQSDGLVLHRPQFWFFSDQTEYGRRIAGEVARLEPERWVVTNAVVMTGTGDPVEHAELVLPTGLTLERIRNSVRDPLQISFWQMPAYIEVQEQSGFDTARHVAVYWSMIAQPFLFAGMVLLAAAFSRRLTRRGGVLAMAVGGVITGFVFFVVNDVILAMGMADLLPLHLAAWAPAGIALLTGTAAILYSEDG